MAGAPVSVSVVSHGQIDLVNQLLTDLSRHCAPGLRVILTRNIPEPDPDLPPHWAHKLEIVVNEHPQGFGANHNAAFRQCETPLFCVVNPDIRLTVDPFPVLAATLQAPRLAAVGPLVRDLRGRAEDSARRFPTAGGLLRKLVAPSVGPDYPTDVGTLTVDWVAGMFIVFRADAFRAVGGFDEQFFLYYEDVDICARLRTAGYSVAYEPGAAVIHEARRASRRNLRLMVIHASSAMRFLIRKYR